MKKFLIIALVVCMALIFVGCGNKEIFDTTYTFDRAIITMPDGSIFEGKIDSWKDFEDGDQIQVKIDSKAYLVHSSNIVLIDD